MLLSYLLLVNFLLLAVWGQTAHQVEDNDAQITYTPLTSWHRNEERNDNDSGGFHMVTDDPMATATFSFVGIGIAFAAPLWADSITTAVALDGGMPEKIDLSDPTQMLQDGGPSTQSSVVLWQRMDLPNTQHTLVVSVGSGQTYALVDALIYYTGDTTNTTSTPGPTSSSLTTDTSTSTTPASPTSPGESSSQGASKAPIGPIIGGVLGGIAILLLTFLLLWLRRRRRIRLRDAGYAVDEPFDMTRERQQGAGVVTTMPTAVNKIHTTHHLPVEAPVLQHPAARNKRSPSFAQDNPAPLLEEPSIAPAPAHLAQNNPSPSIPINAIFHEDSGIRMPIEGPDGVLEFPPMYTVS